jgi:amino acid transporter
MARDGRLPKPLAAIDPKRRVPLVAVLTVAAVTLVLGLLLVDQLELLASMVSFGALIGFFLLHLSVIFHLVRTKTPLGRRVWLPLTGLGVITYVLMNTQMQARIVGLSWLALGVLVLMIYRARAPNAPVTGEGS